MPKSLKFHPAAEAPASAGVAGQGEPGRDRNDRWRGSGTTREPAKAHWRRSLLRFHDLLVPGGLLILETHNALELQEEVEVLLDECGFAPWVGEARRDSSAKYWIALWPTG